MRLALSSGQSLNEFAQLIIKSFGGHNPFDYNIGKPIRMDIIKEMLKDCKLVP